MALAAQPRELLHSILSFLSPSRALREAIHDNNLALVRLLLATDPSLCTATHMDTAAGYGHLGMVKFLHYVGGAGCTTTAMDGAATNGHWEVVLFLHFNRTEGCTTNAMDGAADNGHLKLVQFLHFNRVEGCTVDAMDRAAICGHLEVVQFLHFHRTEGCKASTASDALRDHRIAVTKFLMLHRGEQVGTRLLHSAVLRKRPEILIRDYRRLSPLTTVTPQAKEAAVKRDDDRLETLRALYEGGKSDPTAPSKALISDRGNGQSGEEWPRRRARTFDRVHRDIPTRAAVVEWVDIAERNEDDAMREFVWMAFPSLLE